jgi:deoxyadenosine/deoxycytidine kinase
MHIAIAGNIGSGKTTLTKLLSKHYGWEPQFEDVDDNPYLNDFYKDMQRWSFNLQIYFLNSRFGQVQEIHKGDKDVIQDRTMYEDAHIFAPNLHAMGLMSTRDFENYQSLFKLMNNFIPAPNLLIYLRSSVSNLVEQIQKRGRDYENSIRIDYLSRLNERYEAWISSYDQGHLLIIDVDGLDFQQNKEDLGAIIDKIDAEINGLF